MPIIGSDCYKARRGGRAVATAENASQRPGCGAGEHLAGRPHTTPDHASLASTREAEPGEEKDSAEIAAPVQSLGSSRVS